MHVIYTCFVKIHLKPIKFILSAIFRPLNAPVYKFPCLVIIDLLSIIVFFYFPVNYIKLLNYFLFYNGIYSLAIYQASKQKLRTKYGVLFLYNYIWVIVMSTGLHFITYFQYILCGLLRHTTKMKSSSSSIHFQVDWVHPVCTKCKEQLVEILQQPKHESLPRDIKKIVVQHSPG